MAEIKTGIFAKNVQKRLNRAQEKVLQKLGKADETKDEQFEQVVINFKRQESEGARLQREMKAYMSAIKGMQQASINLTQSLHEVYEPDWHGKDDIVTIGKDCDALWEDFHNKLVDSTLLNLDGYLQQFPDLKVRVAKRSRKLIDYDSARHQLESLQAPGMKNDRKIMKAEEELKKAQKVFDELNVGLQDELPTLWDRRVGFYISTFKCVTSLEAKFHREISLVCRELYEVMTKLREQHADKVFTIQGAPSDSGPLRLARTPSPPDDESPPESPEASSNHMLRPVSPGPPRPKSPIQLKKGPPVPPLPKATPTKEVAEEQIIDLFGGEFLPAPSPSQPNERPGESLLDLDFDAFQPDETVAPIPQTAVPWDMWSANAQPAHPADESGFVADWSADFGSVPANEDDASAAVPAASGTVDEMPEGERFSVQGEAQCWPKPEGSLPDGDLTTVQDSESRAKEDEVSSWETLTHSNLHQSSGVRDENYLVELGRDNVGQEYRRKSTPGLLFTNEFGEEIEDGEGYSGDKRSRSLDGSGSEYETAEEWADGGQGGGWMSADDELSYDYGNIAENKESASNKQESEEQNDPTFLNRNISEAREHRWGMSAKADCSGPDELDSKQCAKSQVGFGFKSDLFAESKEGAGFESDSFAESQGGVGFKSDTLAESPGGIEFESNPLAKSQGGIGFESGPFAQSKGGIGFESGPFAESKGGIGFESDLLVESRGGTGFESDPLAESPGGNGFESNPLTKSQGGIGFESDPFAESQGGIGFESDPFAESKGGIGFESDLLVESQGGTGFESDTLAESPPGGNGFESNPLTKSQGGIGFESDPFAESQGGIGFESDPFAESQVGAGFESDPFAESQVGAGFESDPFAESQGGAGFESDPFAESQGGAGFESDPFAESQGGAGLKSDLFAESQGGAGLKSDPFAESQGGAGFESDPFAESQGGAGFESDPFAESQGGAGFESDPFAESQGGAGFKSDLFAESQAGAGFGCETFYEGQFTDNKVGFGSDPVSGPLMNCGSEVSDIRSSSRDSDTIANSFPTVSSGTEDPTQQTNYICGAAAAGMKEVNKHRNPKEPESSDMSEDEAANRRLEKLYQELDTGKEEDAAASSFFTDFDNMTEAESPEKAQPAEVPQADEEDPHGGETAPSEKMPIPSVVIEPASSNEGDDDRDADIISPSAVSDDGVTHPSHVLKHMTPSGGASGFPDDFLYKVETMHDFEAANSDELELKRGDVVLVVPTASVEDQEAGWLTGMKESDWLSLGVGAPRGLFPENFTQRLD